MACSCHGKSGENLQDRRMPPDSQCLMCAMKHIGMAMEAVHELSYERDNRDFAIAHIRLAMEHTKLQWRDVAVRMRDVGVTIELVQDKSPTHIHEELRAIRDELRRLFDREHPEQAARLRKLRDSVKVDVIIPLGNGSSHGNDELRILLRSIAANCSDVGRVFLATQYCPDWVDRDAVTVVDVPDTERQNKDANLIDKVLSVIGRHKVLRFAFAADDNVFAQPCELKHIPHLHERRREEFTPDSKWRARMVRTFEYFDAIGVSVDYTFDSHCPQYFADAQGLLEAMRGIDYRTPPGLAIMTAFRCAQGDVYGSFHSSAYKQTFEGDCKGRVATATAETLTAKPFIGYNDDGARAGLLDRLLAVFPERCVYEIAQ
ncbi:MAG: hypothetical protein J5833_01560 [Victivallales bacterium]|nr:hypothetical protein [Victivallales bacterium]